MGSVGSSGKKPLIRLSRIIQRVKGVIGRDVCQTSFIGGCNKALTFINGSTNRMIFWVNYFQDPIETRFKRGILNVLPHELSHMCWLGLRGFGGVRKEGRSLASWWGQFFCLTEELLRKDLSGRTKLKKMERKRRRRRKKGYEGIGTLSL